MPTVVPVARDPLVLLFDVQGQAQVGHLHPPVGRAEDVRRLDVPVDDPLAVGVVDALRHLDQDFRRRLSSGSSAARSMCS